MNLWLLGISHHTAPLEERERLAFSEAALPDGLRLLASRPGVREGLILSTCNRVEVLAASPDGAQPDLLEFLQAATRPPQPLRSSSFYRARDAEVARHLFRVASSLDSQVVGEPQILGQLKHAYAAAQAAGTIGPELDALLARAFHAAKRVRTETAIASQPVSVSQAGVDLARQIFGDLNGKVVLLLGAGAAGQAAARYLMQQGTNRLLIANRTLARAQALASKYGAEAVALEALASIGELADVVISCTGAPEPLVRRADAAHFLARRRGRPMLFLDLAVPRDIEPSVHQLENAFVYNVDDLDQVVNVNLSGRRQEAELGEKIIQAEVETYLHRQQAREVAPMLRAVQSQAEAVRAAELERARKRLGALTPEQEEALEAFSRSLMHKWLHGPLVEIKEAARQADREALLEMIQRLYRLEEPEQE
ncbi:MAG: glutamyl-tRNA reductase [Terriglobales bacterium]